MGWLSTLVFALLALAPTARAQDIANTRAPIDYDAEFQRLFPVFAAGNQVTSWGLYEALVVGDLVGYASNIDDGVSQRLHALEEKPYQKQQFVAELRRDRRLRTAFESHGRRVRSMLLYIEVEDDDERPDQRPELAYV